MSGERPDGAATNAPPATTRTATVRTTHADAALVAAALAPDDTESMTTRVDGDAIECTVERATTGGLRSTVDDYVVNLQVADRVIDRARTHRDADGDRPRTDTDGDRPRTDTDGDRPRTDTDATDATETGGDTDTNHTKHE